MKETKMMPLDPRELVKALMFSALVIIGTVWASQVVAAPAEFASARATVRTLHMENSRCSAVILSPIQAVTAAHCNGPNPTVDGRPVQVNPVAGSDFAFVAGQFMCPCATIATAPPMRDEPLVAIGFAFGLPQTATEGRFTGIDPTDGQYITTIPLAPGMSGGGLFVVRNGLLELVGVNVSVARPGTAVSFAEPLR